MKIEICVRDLHKGEVLTHRWFHHNFNQKKEAILETSRIHRLRIDNQAIDSQTMVSCQVKTQPAICKRYAGSADPSSKSYLTPREHL
jgi:hypothetical protein